MFEQCKILINLIKFKVTFQLWGRFSLRNYGLSESIITDDPIILRKYLDDKTIDITGIDILSDEEEDKENDEDSVVMISFLKKKEFVDTHECSNVGE